MNNSNNGASQTDVGCVYHEQNYMCFYFLN